jgi:hypothetical protein
VYVLELSAKNVKEVQNLVKNLLPDFTLEQGYQALGMQLDAIDAINNPVYMGTWMGESIDVKAPKALKDFKQKALKFLKEYADNIVKNACAWWKDNKDKAASTDKIVAGLTPIIATIIPPPWGVIGIVAVIIAILIKAGMDTVCSIGKGKESLLSWIK